MTNTYPLIPNKITETTIAYKTKKVEFEESQYVQRISTRKTPKRTFRLDHYALDPERERLLREFFDAVKGSYLKFYFNNYLDNSVYECWLSDDRLRISRINKELCNISVEIETC